MRRRHIGRLLALLIASWAMISCRSPETLPITRLPEGNVKRLMEMPEFSEVKESGEGVKRWAKEALHVVNDLEYIIRTPDEQ